MESFETYLCDGQSHATAVHTAAAVPLDPLIPRSTKPPAGTVMLPEAVQLPPVAVEQASVVFDIVPGVPVRNVTVIVPDCWE
jgi:hypothetical protein